MKHPSSREFYAYWDAKRGDARAPDRSEIEPGAVRELLGDIFVLAYDSAAGYPFASPEPGLRPARLRPEGSQFFRLFSADGRREIEDIIAVVSEEMLAGGRRHHRHLRGWQSSASGTAAAAVQHPRTFAAEPDRIAGAVRKRLPPAQGFQTDIVALHRSATTIDPAHGATGRGSPPYQRGCAVSVPSQFRRQIFRTTAGFAVSASGGRQLPFIPCHGTW